MVIETTTGLRLRLRLRLMTQSHSYRRANAKTCEDMRVEERLYRSMNRRRIAEYQTGGKASLTLIHSHVVELAPAHLDTFHLSTQSADLAFYPRVDFFDLAVAIR